jgi:hypothetical protein
VSTRTTTRRFVRSSDDETFVGRLLDAKGTVYPSETISIRSRKDAEGKEREEKRGWCACVDNKPAVAVAVGSKTG